MDTVATNAASQTGAVAKKGTHRRTVLLALAVVAAIGAVTWGVRWWVYGRFIESTDDAYLQADSVIVAPKVSNYITEVYVKDNQTVAAGDPLVRLAGRQYQ